MGSPGWHAIQWVVLVGFEDGFRWGIPVHRPRRTPAAQCTRGPPPPFWSLSVPVDMRCASGVVVLAVSWVSLAGSLLCGSVGSVFFSLRECDEYVVCRGACGVMYIGVQMGWGCMLIFVFAWVACCCCGSGCAVCVCSISCVFLGRGVQES